MRRRNLQRGLWLLGRRLAAIEGALEGTPDGEDGTHWEDRAAYHVKTARIALDVAEGLLLADNEPEGP